MLLWIEILVLQLASLSSMHIALQRTGVILQNDFVYFCKSLLVYLLYKILDDKKETKII